MNCVFCGGRVLETVEHLVVDCETLDTIRGIAIDYFSLFELKVPNSDCDAMRLLLTLGLTPIVESKHKSLNNLMLHQSTVTRYGETIGI